MTEENTTMTTEERALPCYVRHEDAGGQCYRPEAMRVHGLAFCAEHGEEARLGALLEEQHEVDTFLERFRDRGTGSPIENALRAMRDHREHEWVSGSDHLDALARAYPDPPEELRERVHGWILGEYPGYEETVIDYLLRAITLTHKLMRVSHGEQMTWMVERLEAERESLSAQVAAALAYAERTEG